MAENPKLREAIEVLLEQLKQQQQEIAETKKTINMLCRRMGVEPMFSDVEEMRLSFGPIRADEYYGKTLLAAVASYLERSKRAATVEEILRAMEQGGYDFVAQGWKENDRLRSLAIALAKNPKAIHKLPNGTFGIRTWYDEAVLKRGENARNDESNE